MRLGKKWLALVLTALFAGLSLTGCGSSVEELGSSAPASSAEENGGTSSTPVRTQSGQTQSGQTQSEQAAVRNPLTGEAGYDEALLNRRPVAVMVNNIKASLPQRGIADADLIYELPVEGAVTRLMAVFTEPAKVPEVGSVRSARHDFVELAKPLNAVYVHFGGSDAGFESIRENGVDSLNGIQLSKVAFFFDETRHQTKATEHCWYTNGELIAAGIAKQGYATEAEAAAPEVFRFAEDAAPGVQRAENVTAPLSGEVTAVYTYESENGLYRREQSGQAHVDEGTGEPVRVRNVFLLYPEVGFLADGLHKEVVLESGEGWYLSGGRAVKIRFEKASASELMRFFYAEGERAGQELKVFPGKSWISAAPTGYLEKLSFGE